MEDRLTECQFADDAALLATTRACAEKAIQVYIEASSQSVWLHSKHS